MQQRFLSATFYYIVSLAEILEDGSNSYTEYRSLVGMLLGGCETANTNQRNVPSPN